MQGLIAAFCVKGLEFDFRIQIYKWLFVLGQCLRLCNYYKNCRTVLKNVWSAAYFFL